MAALGKDNEALYPPVPRSWFLILFSSEGNQHTHIHTQTNDVGSRETWGANRRAPNG